MAVVRRHVTTVGWRAVTVFFLAHSHRAVRVVQYGLADRPEQEPGIPAAPSGADDGEPGGAAGLDQRLACGAVYDLVFHPPDTARRRPPGPRPAVAPPRRPARRAGSCRAEPPGKEASERSTSSTCARPPHGHRAGRLRPGRSGRPRRRPGPRRRRARSARRGRPAGARPARGTAHGRPVRSWSSPAAGTRTAQAPDSHDDQVGGPRLGLQHGQRSSRQHHAEDVDVRHECPCLTHRVLHQTARHREQSDSSRYRKCRAQRQVRRGPGEGVHYPESGLPACGLTGRVRHGVQARCGAVHSHDHRAAHGSSSPRLWPRDREKCLSRPSAPGDSRSTQCASSPPASARPSRAGARPVPPRYPGPLASGADGEGRRAGRTGLSGPVGRLSGQPPARPQCDPTSTASRGAAGRASDRAGPSSGSMAAG